MINQFDYEEHIVIIPKQIKNLYHTNFSSLQRIKWNHKTIDSSAELHTHVYYARMYIMSSFFIAGSYEFIIAVSLPIQYT